MVMRPGHSAPNRLQAQPAGVAFSDQELDELEAHFSQGLTSAEVLRIFTKRGVKLSEGTFRKYVQKKLLPRSKRVGQKGKHQGSKGIYPATIVRQIVAIKSMMASGLTMEQIERSYLRFRPQIEGLEGDIAALFAELYREVEGPQFDVARRDETRSELDEARAEAADLVQRFCELESSVAWSPEQADDGIPDDELDGADAGSGKRWF